VIRKAIIQDIKPIHKLLSHYGEQGSLLSRPLVELYEHLRDFFVVEGSNPKSPIVGVCALGICWEDLAEIRSLAVVQDQQGKNYGSQLVEICLQEALSLGLKRVFTLTYEPDFFSKLGFKEIEKSTLPHKIWADCIRCAKFPDCDEIAMVIEPSKSRENTVKEA
jgi:amino-acid N-acetyltransferase